MNNSQLNMKKNNNRSCYFRRSLTIKKNYTLRNRQDKQFCQIENKKNTNENNNFHA